MKNTTLVIGASTNPDRYSNIAIQRLREKNVKTYALGLKLGKVLDVIIEENRKAYANVDTVTLYLNPKRQENYYDYIISLQPRRVIFNPGTENDAFVKLLEANKIKSEIACTLVLLATDQY